MIDNTDAVRILESKRNDSVIIATMTANRVDIGLPSVTKNEQLDFPVSRPMGKAASVGLGIAIAHPKRKVMVLDGDGGLLMNLGSMVTLSNKAPQNLIHVLFDNGVYAITGGQPVPGGSHVDWSALATGAGYATVFSFENLEDLTTGMDDIMKATGPVFVHLSVIPAIENTAVQFRPKAFRSIRDAIKELPDILGKT